MARTVDQQAHARKRGEILDAALDLVSTRGYEGMAIQDLLDALQISKGAFYHYFDSKGALLEALVDRLLAGAERVLTPIARDPSLAAPDALQRFFAAFARYKAEQRPFIMAVLPVWYADDNAIVREKVRTASIERLTPLVAAIVRRGGAEGAFSVAYPDEAARLVLGLTQDLADRLARALIASREVVPAGASEHAPPRGAQGAAQLVAATEEAVERILAAPAGSIRLAAPGVIETWFGREEGLTA
jgi:AcrR family transcriptional regulator